MKGHMEKDGFHPHTQYKGVRKSRDKSTKNQGVRQKRDWKKVTKNTRLTKGERIRITRADDNRKSFAKVGEENDQDFVEVVRPNQKVRSFFPRNQIEVIRMKRLNVCEPFLEDPASHRPDDTKHTNQIMYSLGDESCASVLTDEEFSMLLTDNQVANTFNPIGETATKWQQDDAFRKRIIGRAQELIEEQKKVNN